MTRTITPARDGVPLGAHDTAPWFRAVDGPLRALARLEEERLAGRLDGADFASARRRVIEGRVVLS